MRRGAVLIGLIAVAFALVASTALGAYKTSPKEGRKYAKQERNDQTGPSSWWKFYNCWRIGPGGYTVPGVTSGNFPGGVVCSFSRSLSVPTSPETVCVVLDIIVKQKKRSIFTLVGRDPYGHRWIGGWCTREPGAPEPGPPGGSKGPALFG